MKPTALIAEGRVEGPEAAWPVWSGREQEADLRYRASAGSSFAGQALRPEPGSGSDCIIQFRHKNCRKNG